MKAQDLRRLTPDELAIAQKVRARIQNSKPVEPESLEIAFLSDEKEYSACVVAIGNSDKIRGIGFSKFNKNDREFIATLGERIAFVRAIRDFYQPSLGLMAIGNAFAASAVN